MGNFNPGLNPTNDPNYTGAAKELNPSDFLHMGNNQREKNLNIFQGIAKGASLAIEGAYNTIKSGIQEDVYEGTDKIRDAQGVGEEVLNTENQAAIAAGNKPADPEIIQGSIARVHAAYQQGKISDRNYYAQLEAMTRSIRSRFPGFREEVDAMVHSVTGITPANALRSSILHDLNRAEESRDASAKEYRSFETSKAPYLPSDYWPRKLAGKPYSEEETRAYVAHQEQQEQQVKQSKAAIELAASQNKLTDERAETTARDNLGVIHQRVMSQAAPFFQEINDRVKSGKPLSPEETQAYTARYQQLKFAANQVYNDYFDQPLQEGSSRTMGGLVKDKRAAMVKERLEVFDTIEKSLFDPKSGLTEMAANASKTIMDNATAEVTKAYPALVGVGVLSKIAGPAAGEVLNIVKTDPNIQRKLTGPIVDIITGQNIAMVTGGESLPSGKTSLNAQLDDFMKTPEGKNPTSLKAKIESMATVAANPGLPRPQAEAAAKFLFGDSENLNFLKRFTEGSQLQVFQNLASPAMTANMKKLGGEHWRNYSNWVKNSFAIAYSSIGQTIADIPNRPYLKISQTADGHFNVEPTPEGIREANAISSHNHGMAKGLLYNLERAHGDNIKTAVDKINRAIDMVAPILKESGSKDVGQEIRNLTRFISITDKKTPGVWETILKFIDSKENPKPLTREDGEKLTFGDSPINFTQASGNEHPGGLTLEEPTKAIDSLKAAFSKGESGDNYNRLVDTPTHPKEINLTSMPIRDVLSYQQGILDAGNKSSAAGKYQVVSKTLRSLVREGTVSLDDKYDEKTQEKIADALLERRGLSDYLDGKVSLKTFMGRLGDEWEIIKKSPAAYHKVMYELERMRLASN